MAERPEGTACVFFVGGTVPLIGEPDTVVLDCPDDYESLPAKVIEFFSSALGTFSFRWLFKCDDDTYVALDRLAALPSDEFDLIGNEFLDHRGAPSGGAGYFLKRDLVERIVELTDLQTTGAEDLIVGEAATRVGACCGTTEMLCWNDKRFPAPGNHVVTSHWCRPTRMRAIHASLFETPEVVAVTHKSWHDRISLFPGGLFSRHLSGCSGIWKKAPGGRVLLNWFDWDPEILLPDKPDAEADGFQDAIARYRCVSLPNGTDTGSPEREETSTADRNRDRARTGNVAPPDGTIVVFLTTSRYGLPHLDRFLQLNPGIPIHVHCTQIAPPGVERSRAWVNCDRPIRDWWLDHGHRLDFRHVVFLEWDVLFDHTLDRVFPGDADYYCGEVKKPGTSWGWFSQIDDLPPDLRPHATGTPPMAVLRLSRGCLEAIFSHPDADECFSRNIQAELRFPTLAVASGYEPEACPGTLSNVGAGTIPPGFGPSVWHAVKVRQLEFPRILAEPEDVARELEPQ